MKKRLFTLFLAICMVCTLLPFGAFAAELVDSGTCGANATWTLDSDGVLTISGTGDMEDYNPENQPPWRSYDNIGSIVIESGITSIGDSAFNYCANFTDITIPDGVTSIGDRAFYWCICLESITIPDSVTSIGDSAFEYCTSLESVVIPDSVTSIGDYAFAGCTSLESITIPDSVTSIGHDAFGYTGLESIAIPDSVTSIDYRAFGYCDSLKSITVDSGNKVYSSSDGVLFNKDKTELVEYPAGKQDSTYTIPDGVTSIGPCAFQSCQNLTSVTIPDGVTSIGFVAFAQCSNLTSIKMTKSITDIVAGAFWVCESLEDVYYCGTEKEWTKITIEEDNECITDAIIHYNAHFWDAGKVTTKATCTEKGVKTYTCAVCGATKTESIASLGHSWDAGKATTKATCTAKGVKTYTCTVCGATKTESIAALGHSWDAGKATTKATCTAKGVKTYTCTVCGATKTESIAALGHSYKNGTCTRCGAKDPNYKPVTKNPFVDVKKGSYYYDAVLWACNHNPQITNGVDKTHFAPSNDCTRGQIVTFLWRANGCPEVKGVKNPFKDVSKSAYYYDAVLWAVSERITTGVDATHFAPDQSCTRGQVVTFLWRTDGCPDAAITKCPFKDVSRGAFYYDAMMWAVGENITNGVDDTHFAPDNICTRGQIVTFLYRDMAQI